MAKKENKLSLEMSKLIIRRLIKHQAIYLPEIGSLLIELEPARLDAKNHRLIPPHRKITFSSQQSGKSLISIIEKIANVSAEQANEIYTRWLGKARSERGITIEGVGRLVDKSFITEERMDQLLNVQSEQSMEITTQRHSFSRWLISTVVAALVVGVLSFGGYKLLKGLAGGEENEPQQLTATIEQPAIVEVVDDVVEVTETVVIEEPKVEPKVEPKPEPKPKPKPAVQPTQMRYRVVGGVFTDDKNTQEYADRYASREGFVVKIYPFGKSQMVSVFESPSISACRRFIAENSAVLGDELWVYERK